MNANRDAVIVFPAREKAELQELPGDARPLAPDELTGRTLVSLVSPGTELGANYLGDTFPARPGYAAAFEVEAVGAEVKDVKPGDLVFATGPQGIGGHRSRQRCPRIAAIPIPGGLAPEVAVHARLMGVTMSTLTTTLARPPDKVLVLGLGPVGHLGAQLFRSAGYTVFAVDPVEARRNLLAAKGVPAFAAVPLEDKTIAGEISLALDCSGHEQAVLDACKAVRKRGEVVMVGVPRVRKTPIHAFDVLAAVFRGYVTLRSGWEWEIARHPADFRVGSVFGNMAGALRWLAEGRVTVDNLYALARPAQAQQVYQDLLHQRSPAPSMLFDWRGAA